MEKTRQYFLSALWMSFYDHSVYRDVAKRWRGTGLAYLLIVLVLSCLISSVIMRVSLSKLLTHAQAVAAHAMPTIFIDQGVVSINEPSPYRVMLPGSDVPFMVIDTGDKPMTLAQSGSDVLITRTEIFVKKDHGNAIEIHQIPSTLNLVVDSALFEFIASKLQFWFPIGYFFVLLLLSFIYRALQALLYILVLKIIAGFCQVKLDFDAGFRLVIVALTPAITLGTLMEILSIQTAFLFLLIYGLLTVFYLWFAVKSNQEKHALEI